MQQETDAHIILADISGYTRFLQENRVTLRHANYILSELLASVMERAEPSVRPEKLEGDAVLFVAPVNNLADNDGAVRRSIFGFFAAFDRRQAELIGHNTCPCEACTTIDRLDIKVITHFGRVLRYKVNAFEELAGIDIVVAHRLLKNSVGATRYLLATDASWSRVAPAEHNLQVERHTEECEGVGAIPIHVIRNGATLPDEPSLPAVRRTPWSRVADFAVKHLLLLPWATSLARHKAEWAVAHGQVGRPE